MTEKDISGIATALRHAGLDETPEGGGVPELLARHVEHLTFTARAIAPIGCLIRRATEYGKQEFQDLSKSDGAVVELFEEHVRRVLDEFIQTPESWDDAASVEFLNQVGVVLGIERSDVPRAIRLFHACAEGQRIGIFMAIEASTPFQYLSREIDECVDDVSVQPPVQSMRNLLKAVWVG